MKQTKYQKMVNSEFSILDINQDEDYFNACIRIADGVGSWTDYIKISPKQLKQIKAILLNGTIINSHSGADVISLWG